MSNRADYWNEKYVQYWKSRTDEAEMSGDKSSMVKGDSKVPNNEDAFDFFNQINYQPEAKLLDFGCGFGRFYDYFKGKNVDYYGIDISKAMIDEARKRYPTASDKFSVSEGEHLTFEDKFFDIIVCYGVFDACYQEQALAEMMRVLATDGYLMFTGKNYNYYEDDEQALVAERNARAKGHPNYFTDALNMKEQLENLGTEIVHERYVLRRSDDADNIYVTKPENYFYEWKYILKKMHDGEYKFSTFAYKYSKTWGRIYGVVDN